MLPTARTRPFMNLGIAELERRFHESHNDPQMLSRLRHELAFRRTQRAHRLLQTVRSLLEKKLETTVVPPHDGSADLTTRTAPLIDANTHRPMPTLTTAARNKLVNLFNFFKAVEQRRTPLVRTLSERPWHLPLSDLPVHSAIRLVAPGADAAFKLEIEQPLLTECPNPPDTLTAWLLSGWDDPVQEQAMRRGTLAELDAEGNVIEQTFEADPLRVSQFEAWQLKREAWAELERPARAAQRVWERFFALHSQLKREGEALEFLLGDGIFVAPYVRHPVLLRRVELEFLPKERLFRIADSDASSEFFAQAFADQPNVPVRQWEEEVRTGELHPLGGEGVSDWFKALIGHFEHGRYEEGEPQAGNGLSLSRAPVLFLRKRESGRIAFLDAILSDLATCEAVPDSLLRIVGEAPPQDELPTEVSNDYANEDAEILMTKLANPAQLAILRRLAHRRGVLVQGPPGTGKTHTIANLIGHLLAEGKTVLVTSHTTKALRVLRDQVVDPLQPLCVSVLDSDAAGKRELETAVRSLGGRLDDDPRQLERQAASLAAERETLRGKIQATRKDLQTAIEGEYLAIVQNGREYSPVEAAKIVAQGLGSDNWLPGNIAADTPPPLSREDLIALYASNESLSPADENDLATPLPDAVLVANPQTVRNRIAELAALEGTNLRLREEFWSAPQADVALDVVFEHVSRVNEQLSQSRSEPWRLAALQAGMQAQTGDAQVWLGICDEVEAVAEKAAAYKMAAFTHAPAFAPDADRAVLKTTLDEIRAHLGTGKALGTLTLLMHPAWKRCIEACGVGHGTSRKPATLEEFDALLQCLMLDTERDSLVARWQTCMVPHGLPALAMSPPEEHAGQFLPAIKSCLAWHAASCQPCLDMLAKQGLDWARLADLAPPVESMLHRIERLRHALLELLPETLTAEHARRRKAALLNEHDEAMTTLAGRPDSPIAIQLHAALQARDVDAYAAHHARFLDLHRLQPLLIERKSLIGKLRTHAPDWASAIQRRQATHGHPHPPGELDTAWRWKQLNQELDRRAALSVPDLQRQLEQHVQDLMKTTAELAEVRAWAALIRRVSKDDAARQALNAWMTATKKLGQGTGKLADIHRAEAARQMGRARTAVPVWIMPFARLTANFDPVRDRFDVLIVDEASQEDVIGLSTFYMADKVIVVGDDEQVTPLDVGGDMQQIQDLIDLWLGELPDKLYDLKTSVYDRAQMAFGSTIRLTEHYRCVPEIIQFSNWLSYSGAIKPLRESASSALKPALVAHRVSGVKTGKKNLVEADTITALLSAAIEHPAYAGKSFGVISLVGDEQAREIETRLRARIDPVDFEQRRILCGNPAHFQGDERDVIFLSMVDSKEDGAGPLGKRGDGADGLWKKRYNVAVSRAKDQLWVVYSLDHATQLKPEDMRRRLIEHALDPGALMRKLDDAEARTESPFEAEVYKLLVARNYRVRTQWQVGAYRIDMVVESSDGKNRLAIECDGDRWHYDRVAEDMARQALLERLGWRFVRIRGTVFYRDRDQAMAPVFTELANRGVAPVEEASPSFAGEETALLSGIKRRANELLAEWIPDRSNRPETNAGSSDSLLRHQLPPAETRYETL